MNRKSKWQEHINVYTNFLTPYNFSCYLLMLSKSHYLIALSYMMSMSGGWFFLVASETVVIGGNTISVPGIGSYIAKAIYEKDIISIIYSVITMFIVIILYDQIIFRPLIVWQINFVMRI